ncbi:hypothetical protein GCM10010512_26370 [Streptomyces thermoviolaceus subsp. thermoviolaceus]|nr:hypothetical protein GCM10010512_26370 [Streptomyces thermoviolaceus subsp. thermoviolaceus]
MSVRSPFAGADCSVFTGADSSVFADAERLRRGAADVVPTETDMAEAPSSSAGANVVPPCTTPLTIRSDLRKCRLGADCQWEDLPSTA